MSESFNKTIWSSQLRFETWWLSWADILVGWKLKRHGLRIFRVNTSSESLLSFSRGQIYQRPEIGVMYTKWQKPIFLHDSNWGILSWVRERKSVIKQNLSIWKVGKSKHHHNRSIPTEFENIRLIMEKSFAKIITNFDQLLFAH